MNQVAQINKENKGMSLSESFASQYNMSPVEMLNTLKSTVFRQSNNQQITDEQMAMLILVAKEYNLNPFTKEIYAFPDKGGIVPVVGVDGWANIINSHPQFDGMEFRSSENMITLDGSQPCPEWMECVIYRKDRSKPLVVREYIDEVYREPFKPKQPGGYVQRGPWQTHTKRFFRHKTMIQAARIAFSFSGIYDQDEAECIIEKDISNNVTVLEREVKQDTKYYSQADFDKNFDSWKDLIEAGKRSADQIIATVESKGALSDEMKMKLIELEH